MHAVIPLAALDQKIHLEMEKKILTYSVHFLFFSFFYGKKALNGH